MEEELRPWSEDSDFEYLRGWVSVPRCLRTGKLYNKKDKEGKKMEKARPPGRSTAFARFRLPGRGLPYVHFRERDRGTLLASPGRAPSFTRSRSSGVGGCGHDC